MLTLIYHPSFHIKQSEGAQIQTPDLHQYKQKAQKYMHLSATVHPCMERYTWMNHKYYY